MTHPEFEQQLDAYVDGELASHEARELAAHLKACPECARLHEARVALGTAIREQVPTFRAPEALRARVQATLRAAVTRSPSRRPLRPVVWQAIAVAASLAAVAVGSWRVAIDRAAGEALTDQVLTSHVRSLMPGHLTDVVSSDQHTVKPWFNGKLDFSPPVYDFAGRGYPLVGGRLEYLDGRPVAALVYGRRQHVINVYVWPTTRGSAGTGGHDASRQGYHLLHWTTPAYAYWVVSDLGLAELNEFAGLIRGGDSAAAAVR
jgi:anti-sigma factor (TIGR02949 family)